MTMNVDTGRIPQWTLSDRLRKAREHAGYEQREFAAVTSMSRGTISAAENGHRTPSKANLKLWALATGVPFTWLVNGETPPTGDGVSESRLSESNRRPFHYKGKGRVAVLPIRKDAA